MSTSTQNVKPDPGALEPQHRRERRWSAGKTVGAVAVVAAIGLAAVASSILGALGGQNPTTPAGEIPTVAPGTSREAQPGGSVTDQALVDGVPEVDYVIDLNTGVMTPLPKAVIRSVVKRGESDLLRYAAPRYAASPDGSLLAYVGTGDEGSLQIFIAGIDGTGIRQMTHDPTGATSPAWSPDGTMIAYEGNGSGGVRNLFVLDVATGEFTQITKRPLESGLQFTSDGSSLLYTGGSGSQAVLQTVPIDGGKSTVLIGPDEGMGHAGNGSLSLDGSLVTMMGNEINGPGAIRFVANADGTERRSIPGGSSNPAGTWSPDGNRIVCSDYDGKNILVVDIATGAASRVAKGNGAIWLDLHTLLVEVS
jgi:Tol biopolymer transport system component